LKAAKIIITQSSSFNHFDSVIEFVSLSEGKFGKGDHVAYYDLFRLEEGKIVEHWDVIENIPAESEWKNTNGKF
jgi:predicted SnoaL-like aldol condensation-catalyzing enzyme